MLPELWYVIVGFLIGSVPVSFLLGRLKGVDLRKEGSGNIGATNLLRTCGKAYGIFGFFGDACKGALPAIISSVILNRGEPVTAIIVLASVLGHVFTPWLGFKGGKGVATALGGLVVLATKPVLFAFCIWLIVFAIFRYVSLASVVAAVCLVPAVFLFIPGKSHITVQLVCTAAALLILYRHKSNIKRLLTREENKLNSGEKI